jgi:predicted ATPase
MIEEIEVRNYRCLRHATVRLGPITVLVGPNGTGKSALLRAISGAPVWEDPWRHEKDEVRVVFRGTDRVVHTHKKGAKSPPPSSILLHPDLQRMRRSATLAPAARIDPYAENVHNVVYSLGRRRGAEYARRFCELVQQYGDVDLRPQAPGTHWLAFQDRWDPDLWFTPDQVSDGTLLVAAYLAASMQVDQPELLLVEEPERGLHPWLIGQVVRLFRSLARPIDGSRPVQIVAATHSADLLRHLEPDEVRFLERDRKTGETTVREAPVDDAHWVEALEAYESMGDLWLSGALGGVPGR